MWFRVRKGGDLQPQTHHLIDVLLPPGGQEAAVLPAQHTGVGHLRGQELNVHQGIEGQDLPLPVQEQLEDGETEHSPVSELQGAGGEGLLGEHDVPADIVIAEGGPALLGGVQPHGLQGAGAGLQHLGAGQPLPDGQQGGQPLGPAGGLGQGRGHPAAGEGEPLPLRQSGDDLPIQGADQLIVHKYHLVSRSWGRERVYPFKNSIFRGEKKERQGKKRRNDSSLRTGRRELGWVREHERAGGPAPGPPPPPPAGWRRTGTATPAAR